jgi:hypothetical protein
MFVSTAPWPYPFQTAGYYSLMQPLLVVLCFFGGMGMKLNIITRIPTVFPSLKFSSLEQAISNTIRPRGYFIGGGNALLAEA